jgi:metallophosphoesterase (TIGR00282 family)
MTILFFGDIVGKIGRKAVAKIIPAWKKKHKADLIIANGENLAHGIGMTEKTVREVFGAGIDFLTGGNHSLKREADFHIWDKELFGSKMVRPANIPDGPGEGVKILNVKKNKLMIINLMGRVFFKTEYSDPFKMIDEILKDKPKNVRCVLLDFHAEATSEKNALGWYLDGRASAVIGTHTHIPTCDAKILPDGTGYITDVGMVGEKDSILGVNKDVIVESFLKETGFKHEIAENGEAVVSAALIKIDEKTGKAKSIKRLEEIVRV